MNQAAVIEFLEALGCSGIKVKPPDAQGKIKVRASCPFARYTHGGGSDKNPSFDVWVNDTGASTYNCFSCKASGWAWGLPEYLKKVSGGRLRNPEAKSVLRANEPRKWGRSSGDFVATHSKMKKRAVAALTRKSELPSEPVLTGRLQQSVLDADFDIERPALEESALDEFRSEPHPYLRDRGFTIDAWNQWGLMWEDTKYGVRIVFPIRDFDGRLLAFSRRVTWDKPTCQWCGATRGVKYGSRRKKGESRARGGCPRCKNRWIWPKYQHSKGFQRNLLLYGEHLINQDLRKGVVVEGNLDPIKLWQIGVNNAVATLGSNPGTRGPDAAAGRPAEQLHRLGMLFDDILVIADGDEAGRTMGSAIEKFFRGWAVSVRVEVCPEGKDPGNMEPDELLDLIGPFGVLRV